MTTTIRNEYPEDHWTNTVNPPFWVREINGRIGQIIERLDALAIRIEELERERGPNV